MNHILDLTYDIMVYGVQSVLFDYFFYAIFGLSALSVIAFLIKYIVRGRR